MYVLRTKLLVTFYPKLLILVNRSLSLSLLRANVSLSPYKYGYTTYPWYQCMFLKSEV